MKVTAVKTFLVHPGVGKNWLFVKLETDEGLHGWGEAYTQSDRDTAIEAHIHQLARYVVGWSPFEIKRFTHMAYEDWATKRGGIDFFCAVSGIEQALWDLAGKAVEQPVYDLLGGPCRDRIRVYANGWTGGARTPQELGARAQEVVQRGFTALKFDPFPGPWRLYVTRAEELAAIERVRAVREAVGPEVEILVEVHRRLAPMHAIRVARMIEEFNPYWYEEALEDFPFREFPPRKFRIYSDEGP